MKPTSPSPKEQRTTDEPVDEAAPERPDSDDAVPVEYGGPRGKEPTRYGDWEKNGRCIDF